MARPRTGLSVRRRYPAAHRGRRADRSGRPATPSGTAASSNPHNLARAPRVRAWAVSVRRPRATPPLGRPASENLNRSGHSVDPADLSRADDAAAAAAAAAALEVEPLDLAGGHALPTSAKG